MIRKALSITILLIFLVACKPVEHIPDWTAVPWGPFKLVDPPGITNPVLTAADVTDRDAQFVADPFLFHESGPWYMFFEVFNRGGTGDIGVATSTDGLHWNYDRIVLDEPFHLSYPYVFKSGDTYYMLPETHQLNEVRIYKALNFPYDWTNIATIITGRKFVDPSIFFFNARWWIFVGDTENTNLYLYSSPSLTKNWVEHPRSPLIQNDGLHARPGGRSFVYNGDQVIRISQSYGEVLSVRAYQVDLLTTRQYAEHELPESPLLAPGPTPMDWYAAGMHQFDPWWTGDHWLVVYDGRALDDNFSIALKLAQGQ